MVNYWQCTEFECVSHVASSVIYPKTGWYEVLHDNQTYWIWVSESDQVSNKSLDLLPMDDSHSQFQHIQPEAMSAFILDLRDSPRSSQIYIADHLFEMGLKVNNQWWLLAGDNHSLILTTPELSFLPMVNIDDDSFIGVSEDRLLYIDLDVELTIRDAIHYPSHLQLIRDGKHLWLYQESRQSWLEVKRGRLQGNELTSEYLPLYDWVNSEIAWTFQQSQASSDLHVIASNQTRPFSLSSVDDTQLQAIIPYPVISTAERPFLALNSAGEIFKLKVHVNNYDTFSNTSIKRLNGGSTLQHYVKSMMTMISGNIFRLRNNLVWGFAVGYDANHQMHIEFLEVGSDSVNAHSIHDFFIHDDSWQLVAVTGIELRNGIIKFDVIEHSNDSQSESGYRQKVYFFNVFQVAQGFIDLDESSLKGIIDGTIGSSNFTPLIAASPNECSFCDEFNANKGIYIDRLWSWRHQ